jgi:CRISPR-associated endonuclease/helicase Cas3
MVSVQLAERCPTIQFVDQRDLILHLIATHHGFARPFAPIVIDKDSPEVKVEGVTLNHEQRNSCPPHRLDSGIAERFWKLTKRYGWPTSRRVQRKTQVPII